MAERWWVVEWFRVMDVMSRDILGLLVWMFSLEEYV